MSESIRAVKACALSKSPEGVTEPLRATFAAARVLAEATFRGFEPYVCAIRKYSHSEEPLRDPSSQAGLTALTQAREVGWSVLIDQAGLKA